MGDELYEIRNQLLLGNFHQAIAEGTNIRTVHKKHEDIQAFNTDRDALVARAQIGLGQYDAVIGDLKTATHPLLLAVRACAHLQKDVAEGRDPAPIVQQLVELSGDAPSPAKSAVAVLAVTALITVKDYSAAMKMATQWITELDAQQNTRAVVELRAAVADCYLRLNRPDLAEKEVAAMKALDDEASLTILMNGIVSLKLGVTKTEKLKDAATAFQDVYDRCGASVTVLNLLALTQLQQGKLQNAERSLLDALAKKSGDPDTIANLVVVASQLQKPQEVTMRYVNQAKAAGGLHNWARSYSAMEDRFREAAASFEPAQ